MSDVFPAAEQTLRFTSSLNLLCVLSSLQPVFLQSQHSWGYHRVLSVRASDTELKRHLALFPVLVRVTSRIVSQNQSLIGQLFTQLLQFLAKVVDLA